MSKYVTFERDEIIHEFDIDEKEAPVNEELIYSNYRMDGYEGSALILYERDEVLWEVHGDHCSCYGLEGQWDPEETSYEILYIQLIRKDSSYYSFRDELMEILEGKALVIFMTALHLANLAPASKYCLDLFPKSINPCVKDSPES